MSSAASRVASASPDAQAVLDARVADEASSGDGEVPAAGTDRGLRWLAAALAILAVLEAGGVLLLAGRGDTRFLLALDFVTVGFLGSMVLYPIVGALVIARRPRTAVAWVMVFMGVSLGTGLFLAAYGVLGVRPPSGGASPFALEALIFSQLFFLPALGTGTTLLVLLYPTDRLLGPRWRIVAVAAILGAVLWDVGTIFRPGDLNPESLPGLANPLAAAPPLSTVLEALPFVANLIAVTAILLAAASLLMRYRRADPAVAAQIRWFGLVMVVGIVPLTVSSFDLGPISDLGFGLGLATLACLPIAIGIAITRYRLYEIDRLINRTLVYGSLTAILAGVFTAGVGLAQRLFVLLTGESSDAALVLTTLVVATLYAPLRKRLEAIIDRRFKYETRRFGSYSDKVKSVLAVIDPVRAAANLAREAVAELDATGAAVVDRAGAVVASAGAWPPSGDSVTRVPLSDAGPLRAILLGPRRGDRTFPPDQLVLLEEAGRLTVAAVRPG